MVYRCRQVNIYQSQLDEVEVIYRDCIGRYLSEWGNEEYIYRFLVLVNASMLGKSRSHAKIWKTKMKLCMSRALASVGIVIDGRRRLVDYV